MCLLLGLWGHTKPEKLVLQSLELGKFIYDAGYLTARQSVQAFQLPLKDEFAVAAGVLLGS